mmetsp:Transcript_8103/g.30438  ORF Transcript_8103/g.30438 Transcript_8103/m.30438 type:complete len:259 (-) Transcript_8103:3280-4056(-)
MPGSSHGADACDAEHLLQLLGPGLDGEGPEPSHGTAVHRQRGHRHLHDLAADPAHRCGEVGAVPSASGAARSRSWRCRGPRRRGRGGSVHWQAHGTLWWHGACSGRRSGRSSCRRPSGARRGRHLQPPAAHHHQHRCVCAARLPHVRAHWPQPRGRRPPRGPRHLRPQDHSRCQHRDGPAHVALWRHLLELAGHAGVPALHLCLPQRVDHHDGHHLHNQAGADLSPLEKAESGAQRFVPCVHSFCTGVRAVSVLCLSR